MIDQLLSNIFIQSTYISAIRSIRDGWSRITTAECVLSSQKLRNLISPIVLNLLSAKSLSDI